MHSTQRKTLRAYALSVFLFFGSLLLLTSCSGSSGSQTSSSDTGSITFSLSAPSGALHKTLTKAATLDCARYGITSVEAFVYDENEQLLAHGGPWDCEAGEGIIYGVKQGTGRTVLVFLKDAENSVKARGEASGITVVAGRITEIGEIPLVYPETINLPPVASNDSMYVNQGGVVSTLDSNANSLLENDMDPERASLTIDTTPMNGPVHGTVEIHTDGTFIYRHNGRSTESDSFTYRISDDRGNTSTAVASIAARPERNIVPVLSECLVSPDKGGTATTYTYSVHYEDADKNAPEYIRVVIDGTAYGMTLSPGSAYSGTYLFATSTELALGDHTYSFECSDGHGGVVTTETYNGPRVVDPGHMPIAADDHTYVNRGGKVSVLDPDQRTSLLANDTASQGMSLELNTTPFRKPNHGTVELHSDGTFIYTHNGEGETDSFAYQITDSEGSTDVATVHITVRPEENFAPELTELNVNPRTGNTAMEFTYTVHYKDRDGNPPVGLMVRVDDTYHQMSLAKGSESPADGAYEYKACLTAGTHTYSFECSDGHGGECSSETFTGPVVGLKPASLTLYQGQSASVLDSGYTSLLSNAGGADGTAIDTSPVSGPGNGNLTIYPDGTFLYTHNGLDSSPDSFSYRVTGGSFGPATGVVNITVLPPDIPHDPVLSNPDASPLKGSVSDTFSFFIHYFDPNADSPDSANVVIDGTPHSMELLSGTASNGTYVFRSILPVGSHQYSFSFIDATGRPCRYPSSGSLSGPTVFTEVCQYYVAPAPIGNDGNTGSAAAPFATIGRALSAVGDVACRTMVISIAAGMYRENVSLAPNVYLLGGWSTDFTSRPGLDTGEAASSPGFETVIAGSGTGRCVTVSRADDVIIEGITIAGYRAPASVTGSGGIFIESCSPVIRNCRIVDNALPAGNYGNGAGMLIESGNPLIMRCTFSNNQACGSEYSYGGAISMSSSAPVITGCTFSGNHAGCATGAGGALFIYNGSSPVIKNCIFTANSTGGGNAMGGAVYVKESSPAFVNCVFSGNSASGTSYGRGGAIYNESGNLTLTNCTLTRNTAGSVGVYGKAGGLFSASSTAPVITNCIFWSNSASSYPDQYKEIYSGAGCAITFCDVDQSNYASDTSRFNFRADPLFANPAVSDFRLPAGSPCRDAGTLAAANLPLTDIDGMPRVMYGLPDLGAFEAR